MTLLYLTLFGCQDDTREAEALSAEADSLSTQLAEQRQIIDSLQAVMKINGAAARSPIYFKREFDTIPNPEAYIANALERQKELIPLDAVLGGTMEFRQVQILTEDWVLAVYDDGHIQGKSIFEYELQPDGNVRFSEVTSKLPDSR